MYPFLETWDMSRKQSKSHVNFFDTKCGHSSMPLLISCKCDGCRQGCGEVKCPYCIDGTDFDSYMQKKSFCLEKKKQFCVQFEKRSWLLSGPATNPHYWLWLLSFHLGCSQGQTNWYESLCHDVIHDYVEEQFKMSG